MSKTFSDFNRSVCFVSSTSSSCPFRECFTSQFARATALLLSLNSTSFLRTPASKPNTRIHALPSEISPSKKEQVLLFFIGDTDITRAWIFAFGEGFDTLLKSSNSSNSRSCLAISHCSPTFQIVTLSHLSRNLNLNTCIPNHTY